MIVMNSQPMKRMPKLPSSRLVELNIRLEISSVLIASSLDSHLTFSLLNVMTLITLKILILIQQLEKVKSRLRRLHPIYFITHIPWLSLIWPDLLRHSTRLLSLICTRRKSWHKRLLNPLLNQPQRVNLLEKILERKLKKKVELEVHKNKGLKEFHQ